MKLSDICDVYSGYALKQFNNDNNGLPVIKIGNILTDGTLSLEECQYSEETVNEKYYSKYGDVYVALSGATTGKIGIMQSTQKHIINQRVGIVRKRDDNIPESYIKYFLLHQTDRILKEASGCAQPNISPKQIALYEIPKLENVTISKIVTSLDKVTSIITLRKKQLEQLDELVKARFVELFGDCENRVRLGDCCDVHARIGWQALTKNEHMKTGEYMLVTGTDFKDGEINYSTCVYVAKERYEMDEHIILKNDDVLITKDGTIGKVAIVRNLPKPATLNAGVFVVRPDDRFNKTYIANVFRGTLFSDFVEDSKTGATIKHLNQKHLVEFMIPVPPINEQNSFAKFIEQTDKSKFVLQKALDEAQTLFDSLMQEYFG